MSLDLYQISKFKDKPATKRTIKFLASCTDPRVQRVVLSSANDSVFKSICNAFLNLAENPEVHISSKKRKLLAAHNPRIKRLLENKVSLEKKRAIIQRGGSLFLGTILPLAISTALSILGTRFLSRSGKRARK